MSDDKVVKLHTTPIDNAIDELLKHRDNLTGLCVVASLNNGEQLLSMFSTKSNASQKIVLLGGLEEVKDCVHGFYSDPEHYIEET